MIFPIFFLCLTYKNSIVVVEKAPPRAIFIFPFGTNQGGHTLDKPI